MVESKEIMTVNTETGELMEVSAERANHGGYINTLDISTVQGRLDSINAYNGAVSLSECKRDVLMIRDAITAPGIRKSRVAGMPDSPCTNTYLIDVKGKAYFTQSDGIADSIAFIASVFPDFGKETMPGGCLPIVIEEIKTASGNTVKRATVVLDEIPQK